MKTTPKKLGASVTENLLSGSSHPPKVKDSDNEGTDDVSIQAGHQRLADPSKPTGEYSNHTLCVMPFNAVAMRSTVIVIRKAKPILKWTVMAKQRSSLI